MQAVKKAVLVLTTTGLAVGVSAGAAFADAEANGNATDSPGVGSGNLVQVPFDVPVNFSGNSGNLGGAGNSVSDNTAINR